jgi:hypothetical protein
MKKITAVIALFSMLFMITPVALKAQNRAKVTITIKSLKATSVDACNAKMDFMGKIKVYGGTVKNFRVMEGNDIRPGWEVTGPSLPGGKPIPVWIEIWDEDDAFCGGGDDAVIVNPTGSQRLSFSVSPADWGVKTTTVIGKRVSGKEQAEITYTTTLVAL